MDGIGKTKSKKWKVVKDLTPRLRNKRKGSHGFYDSIGNGGINYSYGVMDYCDDGNGNVWSEGDYSEEDGYSWEFTRTDQW